jgi:hypothetical protein
MRIDGVVHVVLMCHAVSHEGHIAPRGCRSGSVFQAVPPSQSLVSVFPDESCIQYRSAQMLCFYLFPESWHSKICISVFVGDATVVVGAVRSEHSWVVRGPVTESESGSPGTEERPNMEMIRKPVPAAEVTCQAIDHVFQGIKQGPALAHSPSDPLWQLLY